MSVGRGQEEVAPNNNCVGCGAGCIKEAERKEKLQVSDPCAELSSEIIITFYFIIKFIIIIVKKLTKQILPHNKYCKRVVM